MKKYKLDAKGMACPLPVVKTKKLMEEYDTVETTVDNFTATQNLGKLAEQMDYSIDVKEISSNEYIVTISNEKAVTSSPLIDTSKDRCVLPVIQAKRALEKESTVNLLVTGQKNADKVIEFANEKNYKTDIKEENGVYKISIEREEIAEAEGMIQIKDENYIVVINKKIMGHGSDELGGKLIKGFLYALTEQELLPKKILFYNEGAFLVDKERSHVLKELEELEENGVEILCCGACKDYYNINLAVGNTTNMYFIVEDMRKANRIIRP